MKVIFYIILSLITFSAFGQNQYIKKDGRIIESVSVISRYGHKAYTTCTLDEGFLKHLGPSEIEEYKAPKRRKFVSKEVLDSTYFLEEMYTSSLSLYKFIDKDEFTSFFLEDSLLIEHLEEGTYHDILLKKWPNCIDSTILNNITFDYQSLIAAIKMINTCEEVYVPSPRSFFIGNLSIEKPIGLTKTKAPSIHPRLLYLLDFWEPSHASLGFGYLVKKPFAANMIGFNYGLNASYRQYGGVDVNVLPNGLLQEDSYKTKILNIGIPLSFELSGRYRKTIGFLELGLEPSYNIFNSGLERTVISGFGVTNKEENKIKIEDNLNYAIILGGGVEFKVNTHQFMVNAQAKLRLGTTNTRVFNKQVFAINLGYMIKSESVKQKKKRKAHKRKIKREKRRKKLAKKRAKKKSKMAEKRKKAKIKREKERLKREQKKLKAQSKRSKLKLKREKDKLDRKSKKKKRKNIL